MNFGKMTEIYKKYDGLDRPGPCTNVIKELPVQLFGKFNTSHYFSSNVKRQNMEQRNLDLRKFIAFLFAILETKYTKLTYIVRIKSLSEHINNNSYTSYLLKFKKHSVIYDTILILNYVCPERKT